MVKRVWTLALFAATFASGCSSSVTVQPPVFPVDGRLFVGGKPAAGAVVTFHPQGGETPAIDAVVRDDGRFVPTRSDGAVGMPEGAYVLTVSWPPGKDDRLGGKYSDPGRPVTTLTVKPGVNLLPPISLP